MFIFIGNAELSSQIRPIFPDTNPIGKAWDKTRRPRPGEHKPHCLKQSGLT